MNPKDLRKIVALAVGLSDKVAKGVGFVRVGDLVEALNVEIEFRPLLVEGMVAQPKAGAGVPWKVLIDSDTHGDLTEAIRGESVASPLANRIRNTIAHELVHVLTFTAADTVLDERLSREALVEQIEDETERLSAGLLVAQSAIEDLLSQAMPDGLNVALLSDACRRWAVSPPILVRRFELLPLIADYGLRYHAALRDFAVGIAEWTGKAYAEPCPQWLYSNFSETSPEFILRLRGKEKPSIGELFTAPEFVLNGGTANTVDATVPGGTVANPRSGTVSVRFSVQEISRTKGSRFLWMMRRI